MERLTTFIEWLKEWQIGRPCTVKVTNSWFPLFWYSRKKEEDGITETYLAPFVRVTIFEPLL